MKVTGKHVLSLRPFWRLFAAVSIALTLNITTASATEYTLAVQPILSPDQTLSLIHISEPTRPY